MCSNTAMEIGAGLTLEPAVDARTIADLADVLIERAMIAEPALRAERDLSGLLKQAYFRDRERALSGVSTPLTTLMLETARMIWDHLIDEAARHGGPWPGTPSRLLRNDARVHRVITLVLTRTGHLPPARAARLADTVTSTVIPGGVFRLGYAA
jgi:hypothetical protein